MTTEYICTGGLIFEARVLSEQEADSLAHKNGHPSAESFCREFAGTWLSTKNNKITRNHKLRS